MDGGEGSGKSSKIVLTGTKLGGKDLENIGLQRA